MTDEIMLTIPYPPSVNHYYRYVRTRQYKSVFIDKAGILHRDEVQSIVIDYKRARGYKFNIPYFETERLSLELYVYRYDQRKFDLDNICKAIFDSLQHALVFKNDNQIDKLYIERMQPQKPGKVIVRIKKLC